MSLTKKAVLEIQDLSSQAEILARGNPSQRKQVNVLCQRISTIRQVGLSSNEVRALYAEALNESIAPSKAAASEERLAKAFHRYLRNGDTEYRDLLVGTQSITATQGVAGGYTVPIQTEREIFEALAQTEQILDPNVTHFTMEPSVTLNPQVLTGWDLSTITASQINEAAQQTAGTVPTVAGRVLRANIVYKISLGASFESEDDVPDLASKLARAYGIGMARRIGQDCINGNGSTQPQGLVTVLPTPTYSTATGKLVLADFLQAFFGVNRIYRSLPKCGWLCNDQVYQRIRASTDNSGRPLLSVENDREVLLGKPIFISPSISGLNPSIGNNSQLVFGDLDHFHIRASKPTLQRTTQQTIQDATRGEALYVGRVRCDSALFDPSNGTAPPITSITVTY